MMGHVRCYRVHFCFLEGYAAINKMMNIYEYFNLLTLIIVFAAAMIEFRNDGLQQLVIGTINFI